MADIDQSAPEVETPADMQDAEQQEPDTKEEVETGEESQEEDDSEEVEHDGEKYRIPKKLKDAFMKNADYTQKTQQLADQRREAEAASARIQEEQRAVAEMRQRQEAFRPAYAKLDGLDQRLQEYQGVQWNQLDPQVAQQHWMQFQQLKDARNTLAGQISQAEHQQALQMQHHSAQQMQQAERELASEIKDWSPSTQAKLRDYGKSIGFSDQELSSVTSPKAVKLLHKAMLYDQHVANATKKPAGTPVVPLKVVKSGSGSVTDPNKLSADEWARRRNADLAKRKRS